MSGILVIPLLLLPLTSGCGGEGQAGPASLTEGVWVLDAEPAPFVWAFGRDSSGAFRCLVHELKGGLKFMETPCESATEEGTTLQVRMPNGVRYAGEVDLARGRIDGQLLYVDGGHRQAPLTWVPEDRFPTLRPWDSGDGPYVYRPPDVMDDGWIVGRAPEHGVPTEALEAVVEAILLGEAGFLKSILVSRGDTLLMEEYFHSYGPEDLTPIMSCTKSVSSLLVGLAVQEGRIGGVNTPILDFFPEERQEAASGWADLTMEHLLTMSMALDWTPQETADLHGTGPEAFRRILSREVVGRPGVDWEYVNMNVNLLAGVLYRATGEHAEALAARSLFRPLGITEWDWNGGKTQGFNLMDGSLWLRPRDMGKIGVMMLNGGVWRGRRVVEESWVRESLTPHLRAGNAGEGYGYLWWTMPVPLPERPPLEVAFANGWGSQFILIVPELDLVVVTTGGNQENGKHLAVGEVLATHLFPRIEPSSSM